MSIRTRLRSSETYIIASGLAVLAASLPFLHVAHPRIFFAFALLVSTSEMFEVTLPSGIPFSLGLAPGLGFALYGHHSTAETLAAFGAGMATAMLVRLLSREHIRLVDSAVHLLALAAASGVYQALSRIDGFRIFPVDDRATLKLDLGALLLTSIGMMGAVVLVETTLTALRRAQEEQVPLWPKFVAGARATAALHLAVFSVGALLALSYPALQYWAFPLFLAPLYATQYAYKQFAHIKKTYLQTIAALSKVPEMAGYTPIGHSHRVAGFAKAIARELAVPEEEVSEIEYAALLHDIGRISLSEPEQEAPAEELAMVGAAIVRQTGHFPKVAEMIEKQHVNYRRRGEDTDQDLSIGSRAIKVASAYDDLTKPGGIGLSPRDALDRLYLGMAFEYDPDVIKALTRVLEKKSVI